MEDFRLKTNGKKTQPSVLKVFLVFFFENRFMFFLVGESIDSNIRYAALVDQSCSKTRCGPSICLLPEDLKKMNDLSQSLVGMIPFTVNID